MVKKINIVVFISLFTGIFLSVSRMIYSATLLIVGSQLFRRRWITLIVLIPVAIMLFYMSALPDFDISNLRKDQTIDLTGDQVADSSELPYRVLAREKGLEVWKDHPFWGVGPGMFGSAGAKKYRSPVYEEYNFTLPLRSIGSLDQFWPQALAETGIIGTGAFAVMLLTLFITFALSAKRATINEMRGFFIGLMLSMIAIIIYSFGGILNHPVILFTYCSLVGMGLACEDRK